MKKISTLLLLTLSAALLSGCKTGSAQTDEPSGITTINVNPALSVSSSSKPAAANTPADNNPGEESTEAPEPSEPEDKDIDAYYTYMSKGAGVMIMGGENTQETVKIPETINERTVVAVSGSAKKTLFPKAKTIVLPDTLTSIHSYAFAGCTYLTDINIPGGVTEIGENAFLDCVSLQELEIPASVTKIGAGAFSGCVSLTSINLPDSVSSVAYGAFDSSVEFTLTYKGMTFNAYNINDLYTMLS